MRASAAHGIGDHARNPDVGRRARWSSIERQLPLLILVLLVPTVVILVLWAHSMVRGDLEASALARLRSSASEIQAIVGQTLGVRARWANTLGTRPAVVALARAAPEERAALLEAAREALKPTSNRGGPAVVEVWSTTGERLFRQTHPRIADGETVPPLHAVPSNPPPRSGVLPLRFHEGQLSFDIVGEVREAGPDESPVGPVLGHVVLRRAMTDSRGADLLGRLIVDNGGLWVGNEDGSLWTDLERTVAAPTTEPHGAGGFHERDGVLRVGAGARVEHAPWVVWVEGDAEPLLTPARNLAVGLSALGAVLLVLGGVGALWISRRVSGPLSAATRAAEAIAAGDYARRLVVQRDDEVGRLTQAFNTMAQEVERARSELEDRVTARTADLEQALARLRDAQDDLVRQEKLALLGQLAGSVGHELRNPLGVMSNTVSWLENVLGDVPAEVRERLGMLRRQISMSEKITSDLLDFTRERRAQSTAVSLQQVVEDQILRLGPVGCAIERDFAAAMDPARADAVHAGQVVFNLLTNAVQAIAQQPNGCVVVRTRQHGDRVHLEIEDNGPGVPEPLRAKIFEPLFTTRTHGIGLGLAVSRRLTEDNGGELRLEVPAGGRGARFVFALPALRLVRA
jgi:signal transduction histidine kinase